MATDPAVVDWRPASSPPDIPAGTEIPVVLECTTELGTTRRHVGRYANACPLWDHEKRRVGHVTGWFLRDAKNAMDWLPAGSIPVRWHRVDVEPDKVPERRD